MSDSSEFAAQIRSAFESGTPLAIKGGGSKSFLSPQADPQSGIIDISQHSGIVSYEPTELVITARAGTTITELKSVLSAEGQELPFDPPELTDLDTLGGVVACGVAGPGSPYRGGVRDFMLGTRIINGRGEVLRFGGEVMKNVAGYDVSRLQVGAFGSLGLLLDISLKVLPAHESEASCQFEMKLSEIRDFIQRIERKPLPLQGCCVMPVPSSKSLENGCVVVRFAGSQAAVDKALTEVGGEKMKDGPLFWMSVRDMKHTFFTSRTMPVTDKDSNSEPAARLWRFNVAPTVEVDDFLTTLPEGDGTRQGYLLDNGGRVRWIVSSASKAAMLAHAERFKAGLSLFSAESREFHSTQTADSLPLADLQLRIKAAFDPGNILNRGVLPFARVSSAQEQGTVVDLPKVTALDSAVETRS